MGSEGRGAFPGPRETAKVRAMTDDPHAIFESWFAEARASEPNDPEAVALATADGRGRPSVRMVLMKGHDPRGFVFYTNMGSRKGAELAANVQALRRQLSSDRPD